MTSASVPAEPPFGGIVPLPLMAQGIDGLTASAIKGKGVMPPKGGSAGTEAEIKAAVTYMVGSLK